MQHYWQSVSLGGFRAASPDPSRLDALKSRSSPLPIIISSSIDQIVVVNMAEQDLLDLPGKERLTFPGITDGLAQNFPKTSLQSLNKVGPVSLSLSSDQSLAAGFLGFALILWTQRTQRKSTGSSVGHVQRHEPTWRTSDL